MNETWQHLKTDVLILGSGGAGLCAILHLMDHHPKPQVFLAVRGLFGKSGCTRMVQGGSVSYTHLTLPTTPYV